METTFFVDLSNTILELVNKSLYKCIYKELIELDIVINGIFQTNFFGNKNEYVIYDNNMQHNPLLLENTILKAKIELLEEIIETNTYFNTSSKLDILTNTINDCVKKLDMYIENPTKRMRCSK